ncbi:penicillin-binding protein activator [Reyranella sp.]|uniref:penicillin-binding protein activator n=1 Tax=Reyranella sp. TaxID=1929291 RepID=UPI0025E4DF56|nr:penicillin-binding protein activator [Reyranella sp.]
MRPISRQSFFALVATLLFAGACSDAPQTSTPAKPATTPTGSPVSASGKARIALLLPLSGNAAPIGQSMQQAAEMALFDSGAKELALSAYDSGDTTEAAVEAYRKARAGGAALALGPLFGTSATALAPLVAQGGPTGGINVVSFSNDESAAQRGVWVMGIAAPPQVRRVVDHAIDAGIKRFATFAPQTPYGEQMARTLESHVAVRGGTVVAAELYDPNSYDLMPAARRLSAEAQSKGGVGKLAILVPVAPPRLSAVLASLTAAGIDKDQVQFIGTGVWDINGIGADTMLRGAWYAAPDPARRADFERRFTATYGRPPHRLATLAYDGVGLAGHLARLKPGGDFSAEAITNPTGWSGVDGIFRFLPDGRSERALAVIEIQAARNVVVSPAPGTFAARPVN